MRVKGIYYLCNRKKCVMCEDECNHTDDIKYAKNYRKKPTRAQKIRGFEWINDELYEKISPPGLIEL